MLFFSVYKIKYNVFNNDSSNFLNRGNLISKMFTKWQKFLEEEKEAYDAEMKKIKK